MFKFIIIFGCLFVSVIQSENIKKVDVDIYYESLCPDSKIFLYYYFYPAYKSYSKYLNVRFIPYGKTKIQSDGSYKCHHGERECIRNRIHSCVLDNTKDTDTQMEFIACAMINTAISEQKNCGIKNGVNWDLVSECLSTNRVDYLTELAAEETARQTPGPKFVPTIVFEKKYREEDQTSLTDPEAVIKKYLELESDPIV